MKKLFLSAIALFLCIASVIAEDEGGYYIKNYDVQAHLSEDHTITVTESIDVFFTAKRHGIYRHLPQTMNIRRNEESFDGDTSFLNSSQKKELEKNGFLDYEYKEYVSLLNIEGGDYTTEYEDDIIIFKIGDKNETITGNKHYEISYELMVPEDRIPSNDLFYHTILGSKWDVPIREFTFSLDFEKALPETTDFIVLSGKDGSRGNDANVEYTFSPTQIFGTAHNLEPNTAITFYAYLPEGYFQNQIKTGFSAGLRYALAISAIFFSIAFSIGALTTKHETPIQTVEFYPPDDILASEVGYIIDGSADNEDMFCLVPYFAKKGYLKIVEVPNKRDNTKIHHLELHRLKGLPKNAPKYQKTIFNALFEDSETVRLDKLGKRFGAEIKKAKSELKEVFEDERELYEGDFSALAGCVLPAILSALFYFVNSSSGVLNYLAVFPPLVHITAGLALEKVAKAKLFKKYTILKAFAFLLIEIPVLWYFTSEALVSGLSNQTITLITMIIPVLPVFLSPRFIKMTPYNLEITGKLLGLREFIKLAEVPKLKELITTDAEYFFDVLPYAMVFKLTDRWAKHFTDIRVPNPSWYDSNDRPFDAMLFTHYFVSSVRSSFKHATVSASAASVASTLAGGAAGGGSGGGGGGSW